MKVRDSELSPILKRFVSQHDAEHPIRSGGNVSHGKRHTNESVVSVPVIKGIYYICHRSGLGIGRVQKMIDGNDREYWDFTVVDKVLTAIDRQDALVNGEIEVVE